MENLFRGAGVIAITCKQWGDTGKGKFVDFYAKQADIIVRGTGGDNAGHTIYQDNEEHVFHIVPSGILYDKLGKTNVIGSGTVIYPKTLSSELALLSSKNLTYDNLVVALNAKLILPTHIVLDRAKEAILASGKIGTTGKGIVRAYISHLDRNGLVMNDLLNKDIFYQKLKKHLAEEMALLRSYDPELIKQILQDKHLDNGIYYDPTDLFSIDAIIEQYQKYALNFRDFIDDADDLVKSQVGHKKILLEGAQGALLSIDHGTYPFVTSSDCTVAGLAKGAGLTMADVDISLGIIKGFYMTRVGCGPFPTELGGEASDEWCNFGGSREAEEMTYVSINDKDEYKQGVAIRKAGNEYGATTRRPRRVGWLDLPLLRHAMLSSGPDTILTKLDVLNGLDVIKVCTEYVYNGPLYRFGRHVINNGDPLSVAIPAVEVLEYCQPVYTEFPGWKTSLVGRKAEDLPTELLAIKTFIEKQTGMNAKIISTGPKPEETIFL